ncbi:hypothetical protein HGRIS_005011 [Hohenbuehelia grisea]|uniref:F-box domain-containing protein n=1 Tax=Hohenbuehelia grisea TaxID=104357 RepID=A0ABR3JDQ5_9AGAR
MASISDIPVEVFIDNIFPAIPVSDLLHLTSTNKSLAELGDDDTFWKRKLLEDFNFSTAGTARTTGFKFIYKGLRYLRVFVWGEKSNGRLGRRKFPRAVLPHVASPVQLRIPKTRVVSLVAGGM